MALKLARMEPWDLIAVLPMLQQMAADERRPYPAQDPEDVARVQGWLLDQLPRQDFGAFVVRDGHKAKGVCWGTIEYRPFVHPERYLDGRLIYVMPSHRKRGVAARLLTALYEWGRSMLGPGCVLECKALPDMPAHQMWLEAGFRPVYTRLAWVDAEGHPLPHPPLAPPKPVRDTRRMGGGAA